MILDSDRHALVQGDVSVHLSPQEYTVCDLLMQRPSRLVRYGELLNALWGNDPNGGPDTAQRTITVLVCHIRAKLRAIGADAQLACVWSVGYRMDMVPQQHEHVSVSGHQHGADHGGTFARPDEAERVAAELERLVRS